MKHLIIVFLFCACCYNAQDVSNIQTYKIDCAPRALTRILKVQNDSVFLLRPQVHSPQHTVIGLYNISTNKLIKELDLNVILNDSNPEENADYIIFTENDQIVLFSATREENNLAISKKYINTDLSLSSKNETCKVQLNKKQEYYFFDIKPNKNFYALSVYDHDTHARIRNLNTRFYQLLTLDKQLKPIDNTSFETSDEKKALFRKPDFFNDCGILYQINLGGKNNVIGEKILMLPDSNGHIRKFKSSVLITRDLFIVEKDSSDVISGYCLSYHNPSDKKVDVRLARFTLNFKSGSFDVSDENTIYKSMEGYKVSMLNCQVIRKPGRLKICFHVFGLLLYVNYAEWINQDAVYLDIVPGSFLKTYYLPLHGIHANGTSGYVNLKMVEANNQTIINFNTREDNLSHNLSEYDFIEPLNFAFKRSKPIFYSFSETGEVSKNVSYAENEKSTYLLSESTWADKAGNVYVLHSNKQGKGWTFLLKIPAKNF